MTILEIKFTNDLTFKYVHDLIVEHRPDLIRFIELDDIQNIEHIFEIAHVLDLFNYKSEYVTYRDTFPTELISAEMFFRGLPFTNFILNERI